MKRTLLSRRNALLSRAGSRLALGAFSVVLLIVLVRIIFPSALLAAAAPFFRLSSAISSSTSSIFSGFAATAKLATERDALINDNATLGQENAVLTARVADLERLLGSAPPPAPGVVAGVLARPPLTAYDTLVVGAGSNAGVAVGDVAYASSSIPLGVVTAVAGGSARITLLSAGGEATEGWVGEARVPVTLRGVGSGAFVASAPRAASTTIGDQVYVAGPGSAPVGVVRTQGGEASAPFITLGVAGIVNIFSLPYVIIRHDGSATWPAGSPVATSTTAL